MSAITETEPGGEMVCIAAFSARPRGSDKRPLSGPGREFRVGERVRFLASFFRGSLPDNPVGPTAVFRPLDGDDPGQYVDTRGYFVTLDSWAGLEPHFRDRDSGNKGKG
jgi:hypothetical protein